MHTLFWIVCKIPFNHREFSELNGNRVKLLKIRNPWGSNEWTGDWSDQSTKWTPELKQICGLTDADDGTFFISSDDYLKYYTVTSIAHYYDNYNYVTSKYVFDHQQAYNLIHVKVPSKGKGYVMLNQKNERVYRTAKGIDKFENRNCTGLIFRRNDSGELEYVASVIGSDNRLFVEVEFEQGDYYVGISFPVDQNYTNTSVETFNQNYSKLLGDSTLTIRLGIYSDIDKIVLTRVAENDLPQFNNFISDICFTRAANDDQKYLFTEEGEKDAWRHVVYDHDNSSIGHIVYNNPTDAYINELITFSKLYGINIIPQVYAPEEPPINDESIEDAFERQAVGLLRKKADDSHITYTKLPKAGKQISTQNPLQMLVKVAPHSKAVIVFEKFDEDSALDIDSNVVLNYPLHITIPEHKVKSRKNRIKYNSKLVEIYEMVSEHNSGVLFKYRNKTRDLKLSVHIVFSTLNNLQIGTKSDDINFEEKVEKTENQNQTEENQEEASKAAASGDHDFEIKDSSREVVLVIEPGQTKFFELASVDIFKAYHYDTELEYHVNLSRNAKA